TRDDTYTKHTNGRPHDRDAAARHGEEIYTDEARGPAAPRAARNQMAWLGTRGRERERRRPRSGGGAVELSRAGFGDSAGGPPVSSAAGARRWRRRGRRRTRGVRSAPSDRRR